MKHMNSILFILLVIAIVALTACTSSSTQKENDKNDSLSLSGDSVNSSDNLSETDSASATNAGDTSVVSIAVKDKPTVLIYNFHITNRCASCIAIEEATTKTLNTYFAAEVKQGRIKRQILNVDADANKTISEKYQAFGSGLFITKVLDGKETTADLTGDGFKYAKNKEEKFIEILKNKITEYLK